MDKWFKSPWFVRAISLAFAIILFMFVQVEIDQFQNDSRLTANTNSDVQTIDNVPVNIRIDEEKYVVSGVPEVANITLEGNMGTLTATAKQQNFDLYVDLEGLNEGTHTVDIKHTGIPEELKSYIEPKTVEVTIEERQSKQFDVAVDYIHTDRFSESLEIGKTETDPERVTITSSREVIDQIAIVKVFVDLTDVTESIDSREVPVNVYDANGNELNVRMKPETVNLSVDIDNPSKKVPVSVETKGSPAEGYELTSIEPNTKEVQVFAKSDVLEGIDEIKTKTVSLKDLTESDTFDVNLKLPDGAALAKEDNTVEVTTKLKETRDIENVPIETENLAEDQDLNFVEPENGSMTVTVTGNESDISELTNDDYSVSIDTGDIDDGKHDLPVHISGPDNLDINGEFDEVSVNITS